MNSAIAGQPRIRTGNNLAMPNSYPMTNDTTTLSQLESHLWEAANILRGPVDAADFKTYVFPMLFFKRLSDVHDEEYQAALAEAAGDEEYALFPQNYRFQVPEPGIGKTFLALDCALSVVTGVPWL